MAESFGPRASSDLMLREVVDRCAYCHDQCMAGTPELRATGDQSMAVSRVASLLRSTWLADQPWDHDIAERCFLGLDDGLQFEYCIYRAEGQRIEPYLRRARREAVETGFAPASVERLRRQLTATGNVFGIDETLGEPVMSVPGAAILVHDAASRFLMPEGLEAARNLLRIVDGHVAEVAVASCGAVEKDFGLWDLGQQASERMVAQLRALPSGPLVAIDATVVLALREGVRTPGLGTGRTVLHLSEYLARHPRLPDPVHRADISVVYHDSGPLARGLGIVDEPRTLLRTIVDGGLLEATPTGRRASSDGPLAGYPRPDIALGMAQIRVSELVATGADCIVAACPYSLRNLRAAGPSVPVLDLWALLVAGWGAAPDTAVRDLLGQTHAGARL